MTIPPRTMHRFTHTTSDLQGSGQAKRPSDHGGRRRAAPAGTQNKRTASRLADRRKHGPSGPRRGCAVIRAAKRQELRRAGCARPSIEISGGWRRAAPAGTQNKRTASRLAGRRKHGPSGPRRGCAVIRAAKRQELRRAGCARPSIEISGGWRRAAPAGTQNKRTAKGGSFILERVTRLELATSTLARWRSTR